MSKDNEALDLGVGILLGVIGGVLAGVLLAPKKGEDSRKDIKDAVLNFAENQAPRVQVAKQKALDAVDYVKFKVEKQIKKISDAINCDKMEKAKELEEKNSEYNL